MADEKIGLEAVLEDEDFQKGLSSFQSGLDSMSQQTGVVADMVSGIFMGLGMKIVEWGASAALAIVDTFAQIGQAIWENGQLMDEAFDGIAIATGATGEELALLQEDFRTVFASVPVDAQTVSEAISLLNQRFEVTGETLTDLATPLLEASRLMGEDAAGNATALADAMGLWNVSTEEGAGLLDELFVAAQESGMGMGTLLSTLTTSTPALQAMGFSLDESIALLATFEDAGINSSTAILGMRTALADFTAAGIPAREGLTNLITEIQAAPDATTAMNMAIEAFGTRAGPAMVTAIQNGTFNLEEMLAVLESADGTIMATAASTADFGEQWQLFQNQTQLALEPLGAALLGVSTTLMTSLQPAFTGLVDIFTNSIVPVIETNVLPLINQLVAAFGLLMTGDFAGAMAAIFPPEMATNITNIATTFGAWVTTSLIPFATDFWVNILQPALSGLWTWLSTNIPLAISTLSTFWTGTLVPAIGTLSTFWTETLQPALAAMWEYFTNNILPALVELGDWYITNIPVIIAQIGAWWNDTLQPALSEMFAAFSENILPILADVAVWFGETLPMAVSVLTDFWSNVLLPIITTVADWIITNLVPVLADLASWFMESIPVAIQTTSDFWNNTLLPAISAVWDFLSTYVIPIFTALADILTGVLGIAVDALAIIWSEVLLPALSGVWSFISTSLQPILTGLSDFFSTVIGPPVQGFVDGALAGLSTGLETIKGALSSVITFLNTLAEIVANFDVEALWALIGQSPAPLAIGLASISAELPAVIDGLSQLQGLIVGGPITGNIDDFADAVIRLGDLSLSKGFSSFGGAIAGRLKKDMQGVADNIEAINLQMAQLEEGGVDVTEASTWLELEKQRNIATEEYLAAQKEIADFQKAQQDFAFLQQQMDFLDFLKENGLEAADILGGVKLGLDADMPALLAAMTQAMQQLIGVAEGELEIGSPSHVFSAIAENLMNSMSNTITGLANLPGRAMQTAMDAMITPARAAVPIMSGAISKTMNINMTNNISQGADFGQFEAMLDRYFARAFA